ncbi:MAG: glucans biosynthesis glucosyltransferase MdoH [Rhodospirillales bacterium]|nr:glucans biosynthesis glucosyltransferase MdoH [Rhodospirillales bacterium]
MPQPLPALEGQAPAAPGSALNMIARRLAFASAVTLTMSAAIAAFIHVFRADGLTIADMVMTVLFALTLPWPVIGFWNAAIGFLFMRRGSAARSVLLPIAGLEDATSPITTRTAIAMTLYNEEPEDGFRRLRETIASLDRTGASDAFAVFVLSDTVDPAIAAREEALFAAWQAEDARPQRLHYRRRSHNEGFKAGNIRDFCDRWGDRFDFLMVLDIDSLMTGPTIVRLVRIMQANDRLGILQSLVSGLPTVSPFPRIFQFGMRHGMRTYTTGSVWWQGNSGPYWGHNAIIRIAPFHRHCRLPVLAGRGPLSGDILSHDQVEAVLMRRAGYDVRVLPFETGSFEENPPTLPDFLKRDLRWCQGNLQYVRLLGMPGLKPLGRVQLLLAILMYTGAPCWLLLLALGFGQAAAFATGWVTPATPLPAPDPSVAIVGWCLFAAVMAISLGPKLFGWLDTLIDAEQRRAFGGGGRVIAGAGLELLTSVLLAPVIALAQTLFIAGLPFGRRIGWPAQRRAGRDLPLSQAIRGSWPQVVAGASVVGVLAATVPGLLPLAMPVAAGLLLAPVVATLTADRRIGRAMARAGLCAVPEDRYPPAEVAAVVDFLAKTRAATARPAAGRRQPRADVPEGIEA